MELNIDWWQVLQPALATLWKLWPLWLLLITLAGIRIAFEILGIEIENWAHRRKFRDGESWRSDREQITFLRGMNPADFERYIADLFGRLGYETKRVGGAYDGGVDVVIQKDGVTSYVQCKKYGSSKVGVSEVRDFYGALADRLAQGKGYFITTNIFTLEAERFAKDKPIELVDQYGLLRYIRLAGGDRPKEDIVAKCPKCGSALVKRTNKKNGQEFFGCTNFPKCRYTRQVE